jgi:hypothetical protein
MARLYKAHTRGSVAVLNYSITEGGGQNLQAQVEIRPPTFPNMTLVPIPADRDVSDKRLAETCALVREPKGKAPEVIRNVACDEIR